MDKTSLFKQSGLPDQFGYVVLTFSFILLLSPYFSGADFGVLKIPSFAPSTKRWLKIVGPALLGICVFCFLPIFSGDQPATSVLESNPELKPFIKEGKGNNFVGFGGNALDAKWKILEEDRKHWTLQSNKSLLIITQKGSIWGASKNLKNQFIWDRGLPKRDFEVIVKASIQIQGQGNSLSVALFRDDDNFLEIGYWGQPWGGNIRRVPYFTKEQESQDFSIFPDRSVYGVASSPEVVYLKIEREGNQFNGYYAFVENKAPDSIDDIRWTKIGTQAWINFDGRLSLYACNGESDAPEVAVQFDFVLIREK